VKIELDSGEIEITCLPVITNLSKEEFSRKDIGELYNLRWKIETGFLHLKYAVRVEDFMGIKENSIKQEFFASLFKTNLFMLFVNVADEIIFNKKKRMRSMDTKLT
jgi:IS4 transposase